MYEALKEQLKKFLKQIKNLFYGKPKKIVIVYSSDNNRIDERGGPYKVEIE